MKFIRPVFNHKNVNRRAAIAEAELTSRRIHAVIAKQDYTRADQALTDGFYEGFYSDDSLLSRIEEETCGGRTGSPGEPGKNFRTTSQQNINLLWHLSLGMLRFIGTRALGPMALESCAYKPATFLTEVL